MRDSVKNPLMDKQKLGGLEFTEIIITFARQRKNRIFAL